MCHWKLETRKAVLSNTEEGKDEIMDVSIGVEDGMSVLSNTDERNNESKGVCVLEDGDRKGCFVEQ